jgi:hypothetical protein
MLLFSLDVFFFACVETFLVSLPPIFLGLKGFVVVVVMETL